MFNSNTNRTKMQDYTNIYTNMTKIWPIYMSFVDHRQKNKDIRIL